MKTVAVILAGGIGSRVGGKLPKQFLIVNNKPVIVHTIVNFEKNSRVDGIVVVCEKNWIDYLKQMIDDFKITKIIDVIPGGETGHVSTSNAIFYLKEFLSPDDYVIIHDAARPILPQQAINNMLDVALDKGNASLAIPCHETVIFTEDGESGIKDLDRTTIMRVQTPQAYRYSFILPLYEKAKEEGKKDFIYADLVAIYYGKRVYFSKGFVNNIKITHKEDISLCESLMQFSEEQLYT